VNLPGLPRRHRGSRSRRTAWGEALASPRRRADGEGCRINAEERAGPAGGRNRGGREHRSAGFPGDESQHAPPGAIGSLLACVSWQHFEFRLKDERCRRSHPGARRGRRFGWTGYSRASGSSGTSGSVPSSPAARARRRTWSPSPGSMLRVLPESHLTSSWPFPRRGSQRVTVPWSPGRRRVSGCCPALKMPMRQASWVLMMGGEKTPPGFAAAGFCR
jgi:hypothetical protein